MDTAPRRTSAATRPTTKPGDKIRILLVEDAPVLRYAFARIMRMRGFEVCEVADGMTALERLHDFNPQFVLADLIMPVMGGIELIQRIREDPQTCGVPIVAITADATDQVRRQALDAGAVDFLAKPIELSVLLERLSAPPSEYTRPVEAPTGSQAPPRLSTRQRTV